MWSLPLLGLLVLSPIMAIAWAVQRRTRNAGVVDVLWCLGLAGLGGFYGLAAEGWAPRRLLVGGLAFTWYVRLGMHLAHRVSSEEEDGRYKGLREELAALRAAAARQGRRGAAPGAGARPAGRKALREKDKVRRRRSSAPRKSFWRKGPEPERECRNSEGGQNGLLSLHTFSCLTRQSSGSYY